jgi:8-oxo-dGTP pyrophosphatase MutT (NUDIX family)
VAIDVGLEAIRRALALHDPKPYAGPEPPRRAAVATVLRPGPDETEVLLIRRAEREGDPWSGHMAFPGGHFDARDPDLLATATREAREEVGLDLRGHELLGRLDDLAAIAGGRPTGVVVSPFVFAVPAQVELRPNYEVAQLLWAPLGRMLRGELDAVKELTRGGKQTRFPGYRVRDQVVWGMTHRMLHSLFDALGR